MMFFIWIMIEFSMEKCVMEQMCVKRNCERTNRALSVLAEQVKKLNEENEELYFVLLVFL